MVAERVGLTASSAGAMAPRPRRHRSLREELNEAMDEGAVPACGSAPNQGNVQRDQEMTPTHAHSERRKGRSPTPRKVKVVAYASRTEDNSFRAPQAGQGGDEEEELLELQEDDGEEEEKLEPSEYGDDEGETEEDKAK